MNFNLLSDIIHIYRFRTILLSNPYSYCFWLTKNECCLLRVNESDWHKFITDLWAHTTTATWAQGRLCLIFYVPLVSIAGSAVGFKLDSLLKLSETRARNNKMTLMHYLCKVYVTGFMAFFFVLIFVFFFFVFLLASFLQMCISK